MTTEEKCNRGRPRCAKTHHAILQATLELIAEQGYADLRIDEVAKHAGVGKQTIYRWWRNKAELCIEALLEEIHHTRLPDHPQGNTLRDDLLELASAISRRLNTPTARNLLVGVISASRVEDGSLASFRLQFLETRREAIREIFNRHENNVRLRSGFDLELAVDMLHGPMWYRLLMDHGPLDEAFVRALVEGVVRLAVEEER
ncbi:TetR/AcrR family transcriptional regulator [Desulforhopalus vacuolatus]|uniref:TetR/AcrR family transcriptional regulator n=1 Tax=Desulforhopalus vacuolatus TaxID=40414 RepID=UPI0019630EE9|nr:TetR/AcrR family transcriptional regulator [Desulforhopalus vacuolatus]MBM9519390.1 TetR/AcrR family transcriptional regulator [Desulforhopalus vacuolatus]